MTASLEKVLARASTKATPCSVEEAEHWRRSLLTGIIDGSFPCFGSLPSFERQTIHAIVASALTEMKLWCEAFHNAPLNFAISTSNSSEGWHKNLKKNSNLTKRTTLWNAVRLTAQFLIGQGNHLLCKDMELLMRDLVEHDTYYDSYRRFLTPSAARRLAAAFQRQSCYSIVHVECIQDRKTRVTVAWDNNVESDNESDDADGEKDVDGDFVMSESGIDIAVDPAVAQQQLARAVYCALRGTDSPREVSCVRCRRRFDL